MIENVRACCAHLHVEYNPNDHGNGTLSDKWICRDCKTKFVPAHCTAPLEARIKELEMEKEEAYQWEVQDRDVTDESILVLATIASNAMFWRNDAIKRLRDEIAELKASIPEKARLAAEIIESEVWKCNEVSTLDEIIAIVTLVMDGTMNCAKCGTSLVEAKRTAKYGESTFLPKCPKCGEILDLRKQMKLVTFKEEK